VELLEYTRRLIALREAHPVLRRRCWFLGRSIRGEVQDLGWFTPEGREMTDDDWHRGTARALGVYLNGEGIASTDERGQRTADDSFFLLFNAEEEAVSLRLPEREDLPERWQEILATATGLRDAGGPVGSAPQRTSPPQHRPKETTPWIRPSPDASFGRTSPPRRPGASC
jgi:glycogen operon protein